MFGKKPPKQSKQKQPKQRQPKQPNQQQPKQKQPKQKRSWFRRNQTISEEIPIIEEIGMNNISDEEIKRINATKKKQESLAERQREQRKQREKSKEVKNVTGFEFMIENILNRATKGELDVQSNMFEISYARIMSEEHKKRVIQIITFPTMVKAGHLEHLREKAYSQIPVEFRKTSNINILEHIQPSNYDFALQGRKLRQMERNFRKQRISTLQEKVIKEADIRSGGYGGHNRNSVEHLENNLKRIDRKLDSFDHIQQHQYRGGATLKSTVFIEVTGETLEQTDRLAEVMEGLLKTNKYKYYTLTTDLKFYLKNFGLANINHVITDKEYEVHPMISTSDVSALTTTYEEGIVRSPQGDIYIGHSLSSNYPVDISFSESTDASNILIVADSGSGKTVFSKVTALYSIMHNKGTYNVVVNDYKGGEWDSLLIKSGVKVSMGLDDPVFINTLEIPDHKEYGFKREETSFQLTSNFTSNLLAVLTGIDEPRLESAVSNICSDIIKQVYLNAGVDRQVVQTYSNSKDINFREAINEALTYVTVESTDMRHRHDINLLKEVKTNLEPYFSPRGSKCYMFQKGVSLDTLMKSKMIIFDYGTQTVGGEATLLSKEVNARIFQKDFFTTLYTAKNKLKGEYTVEYDEEVQRQLNNRLLARALNDKITGGRSSNKVNILITNAVTGLLTSTDQDISAIRDNINSVLIGRCKKNVMNDVIDFFDLQSAQQLADKVRLGIGRYKHSFLCAINTGNYYRITATSMKIPPSAMESGIFDSKIVEKSNKTSMI